MKEFIYLDTSFLHSFLAQTYKGLPVSSDLEVQESESKTSLEGSTDDLTMDFNTEASSGNLDIGILSIPSLKGRLGITSKGSETESLNITQLDATKEIISKQLHDNALIEFEQYLSNNELLHVNSVGAIENDLRSGDYIKITSDFKIIDFDLFNEVINQDLFNILKMLSPEHKLSSSNNEKKYQNSKKKNRQNETEQSFEPFTTIFRYLPAVLPTTTFIKIENFVAPLKKEFLRHSTKELNFKYGSIVTETEITLIGKVTRSGLHSTSKKNQDSTDFITAFSDLASGLNQVLESISLVNEDDLIITPIAIYFD